MQSSQFSSCSHLEGVFMAIPELDKDPYHETRPHIASFTRHKEFFKDSCRPGNLKTETATFCLGLRSQTPAFDARLGHPVLHAGQLRPAADQEKPIRRARREAETKRREVEAPRVWNRYFQQREHSFDMLKSFYAEQAEGDLDFSLSPQRTPRVHVDTADFRKTLEPWKPKVAEQNANLWNPLLCAGDTTAVINHMLSMR